MDSIIGSGVDRTSEVRSVLPLPFSVAVWGGLNRVIVQISQFMITILEPRFIPIMSLDMFSLDWANHVMS